ncbi:collagen alpha-1 chain [Cystoisospora suis]|uniref:Collagen alpha-1 chain n=1 Tax=Cystoisospora suis TaxID=483139 RepID=A0A2C6KKI6_9APIC|nr:collagen alpha-1 chain [Cystoisospora suis]
MPPNSSHLQGSGSQYPPYSPFPTLSSPQGGLNGGGGGGSRRGPESSHQLQQSSRSACTLPSYSPVPYSCGPSTGSLTVAPPPSSSQLLHSSRSLSSYPSSGKSTDSPSVTSSVCNTSSASYTSPSPPPLTSTSSTSPQAPGPFGSGSYLSPSSRRPLSSSQPAVITQLACQEPPGQPNRQGSGVPASPSFPVNGPGLPRPSASTRRSGKDQQTQDVPTAATFESDRDGMARLFGGDTHPATGSCEMPTSAPSKVDRGVEERRMPVPSEAGQDIRPASSGVSAPGSSTYVSAAMPPGAAAGPSSGRSEQLVGSSSSVSHAEARKSSSDGVSKSSDSHSISSPSTHADESVSSGGSNRVPIARGAGLPPPITRTVSPGGWREGARSSSGTAPGKGTHGPRAGQGGTAGQGAGRQLLKSLNFSKTLFMTEAFTDKKLNVASNTLRKNYENFVLIRNKNAIVLPGPKKAKDHPRGTIIAYNSGYIVAAATREQFVGMNLSQSAPAPSSSASTSSTDLVKKSTSSPVSLSPESSALPVPAKREAGGQSPSPIIASAPQGAPIYADWIRKKFRSHEAEPLCRDNGYTRPLTLMTRADIDPPNEIFLEELRDFIFLHFPRWFVAYDPEVAPCLVLGKQFEKMSNQILQPQLSPGSFKSFPSGSFLNPRTLGDGSPKPTGSSFVSATNEAGKSPSLPLNSAGSFPSADGSVDTSGTRPSGQYLNACAISRGGDNTGAGVSRSARILPSFSRSPSPSRYSTAFSSTRRKQGFSLLPDSSRRAASSPLRAATEAAAEAWGVDATQLLFPHLPSHSHLWPPEEKIVAWRRKEEEARAEGREYLQCIFIIGVRHVIAHGVKSQQTLFAAVSELWPLLRYFIGSPEVRFKPKTGERRADRNSAGESFSKSAEDGRDFKRRRHGGEVLASQAIAREMLQ